MKRMMLLGRKSGVGVIQPNLAVRDDRISIQKGLDDAGSVTDENGAVEFLRSWDGYIETVRPSGFELREEWFSKKPGAGRGKERNGGGCELCW